MGFGYLIVGAQLYLLALHLLRVILAGLLEDRALELLLLGGLPFLRQHCDVLISLVNIFWLGLPVLLGCHLRLVLLPLHHNELESRHSLADQDHMEADQREQHERKR